ncbi:MAG: SDR family oxidoreductase [Pseudomonadota bacterium]
MSDLQKPTDLTNKVVVITGASRGIGAAAARGFAAVGAIPILIARSQQAIEELAADIRDGGGQARAYAADVADYADVSRIMTDARDAFGSVDILINNAGIIEPIARLGDSDPEAWRQVVDINLTGVYNCIHAALPHMQAHGSGTIINISSGAATSPLEGWSHYCSTKAAVLMLTRMVDKEYGDAGIRCVGLSPGTVATDMQVKIKASGVNPVSTLSWDDHIPPEWVARTLVWMCTPDGSAVRGDDIRLRDEDVRRAVGLG